MKGTAPATAKVARHNGMYMGVGCGEQQGDSVGLTEQMGGNTLNGCMRWRWRGRTRCGLCSHVGRGGVASGTSGHI
jgi:hypothetical protein